MPSELGAAAAPQVNVAEFTVSELAFALKRVVEDNFAYVRLRGEVSRYRGPHSSGHCYFTLKDEKAAIDAVIWRGTFGKLAFKPEDGLEVIATGRITTYPNKSTYQIVIEALEPAGIGALLAQLEKLKQKLSAEGLFAEERKKPLPFMPGVVGVVTSPTGAVIRDMLHGFTERFPTHVVLWPVRVQGQACAPEVAAAVRGFNALGAGGRVPRPDLIIVARGGGSLEDLWGFNEESVARAVADSAIPVIAAVGHETDWTLIDLVADARAPTPTKAAEWAVPKLSDLLERGADLGRRHRLVLRRGLEGMRSRLTAAARGVPRLQDLLALPRQRLDACAHRLPRALRANAHRHHTHFSAIGGRLRPHVLGQRASIGRERLAVLSRRAGTGFRQMVATRRARADAHAKLLASLSYRSILERGFALVRDEAGAMVRRAAAVAPGAALEVQFADGRVPVTAEGTGSGEAKPAPRRKSAKPKGTQGSLF